MTAQARSRDLDANNLVLLGIIKSAPAPSSAVDKIDLADMGLKGMAVIFYGKTEAAMVAALREAGMLSEDLITHPMHDDQEVNSCWFD